MFFFKNSNQYNIQDVEWILLILKQLSVLRDFLRFEKFAEFIIRLSNDISNAKLRD